MGFPLRSWGDIIDRREEFEERLKPAFFCFVLYKSSHVNFREFILRNFNMLHEDSRDVIFFVLDTPEDWLKREDIEYYRSMYGNHYNPELNDQQVDLVCDYFSIHPNKLPAIVAFPNLSSRSCNVFSLKDIENNTELLSIFKTLFQHGRNVEYGYGRKYSNNLLDIRSQVLRRRFPTISTQISYFEDSRNIIYKFEQLNETITQMRDEMREGFNTIISKLENIQEQIKPFKLALADKFKELEKLPQSNLKDKEIEELHNKVDKDLIKYSKQIMDDLGADQFLSLAEFDFLECFEEDSLNMIRSCFITEKLVMKERVSEFDYSLCSVGFWKAMEIELNIILIDTIRLIKNVIDTIPSSGISIKSGKCEVFAGYKWIKSVKQEYKININNKREDKLCSFMFGDLIKVSEYYKQNEFNNVLEIIYEEASTMIDVHSFMNGLVNQLTDVVHNFRNQCSHTGIMKEDEFRNLKNIIFSEEGLYKKISQLKFNIDKLSTLPTE